jgi:hypothetical protein
LTLLRGCVETPADSPDSGFPLVHQTLPHLGHANDSPLDQWHSSFESPNHNPITIII